MQTKLCQKDKWERKTESNCALIPRHQGNYKNGNPGDISAKARLWKTGAPLQSLRLAADWTGREVDCSTVELKLKNINLRRGKIFMLLMLITQHTVEAPSWVAPDTGPPDAQAGQLPASTHFGCFLFCSSNDQ